MVTPLRPQPQRLSPAQLADFNRRAQVLAADEGSPHLEARCRQLVRDYPGQALSHFLLGRNLVDQERMQEAFRHVEAAWRLEPQNANYCYYLGFVYSILGLPDLALPLLQEAHQKGGTNIVLFAQALAECYLAIGRGDLAASIATRAISLCKHQIDANRLRELVCRIHILSNEPELAEPHLEHLTAAGGSFAVKATIWNSKVRREGSDSETGRQLRHLLQDDTLSAMDRSDVLLALGRLHEHDKNHAEAFACWEKSRQIAVRTAPAPKDYECYIAEVKSLFSPYIFEKLREFGNQSDQPVFIVGMPRSGTTLTEQIIGSHPNAAGVGELQNLGRLALLFKDKCIEVGGPEAILACSRSGELQSLADEGLQFMRRLAGRPAVRIVEKMPHHFMVLGFLALFYPKASFVHCLRNPFDTFISAYQNRLSHHHAYSYTQEGFAHEYLAHIQLMDFWKSLISERILTLPYEALATAPAKWAPRIIEFVGLPWHDDCLRFFEKAGTVRTISAQQVRNPVYSSSVERWRAYETQLQPLIRMLAEAGYEHPFDS